MQFIYPRLISQSPKLSVDSKYLLQIIRSVTYIYKNQSPLVLLTKNLLILNFFQQQRSHGCHVLKNLIQIFHVCRLQSNLIFLECRASIVIHRLTMYYDGCTALQTALSPKISVIFRTRGEAEEIDFLRFQKRVH